MNTKKIGTASAIAATALLLAGGIFAGSASADDSSWSRFTRRTSQDLSKAQSDKNTMRNVTIGLGAAAAYEALRGKGTNALLLGAGAALSGSQYEKDRKVENDNNWGRYGDNSRRDRSFDRRDDHDVRRDDRDARQDHHEDRNDRNVSYNTHQRGR